MHNLACKSAPPTGIAAANIEIDGTAVSAATLHNVFDLGSDYVSKLDFTKPGLEKVGAILSLKVLLLDEATLIETRVHPYAHAQERRRTLMHGNAVVHAQTRVAGRLLLGGEFSWRSVAFGAERSA